MGTWGIYPFDNDAAADWAWELAESEDLSFLQSTLEAPLTDEAEDYVASDLAERVLAAAEVVAAMLGRGERELSQEVREWVNKHQSKVCGESELVKTAMEAVARVAADSELRDIWEASDDFQDWEQMVVQLQNRISGQRM